MCRTVQKKRQVREEGQVCRKERSQKSAVSRQGESKRCEKRGCVQDRGVCSVQV